MPIPGARTAATLVLASLFAFDPHWIVSGLSWPGPDVVHADDDDDDDDDDGGGGGGGGRRGSGPSGGGSGDSRTPARGDGPYLLDSLFGDDRPAARSRPRRPAPPPPSAAADEVVVDSASAETIDRLVAEGFEVIATSPAGQPRRLVRFRVPAGLSVDEAIARVGVVDPASSADRNHYYRPQQETDDGAACTAEVCRDWSRIGWRLDVDRSCVGAVTVGVVDTGVNPDHEALAGGRVEVLTLRADGEPPSDRKHGTAVVALLAGQPGSRIPGLVPAARIVAADPFSRVGTDERSDVFALVSAVEAVAAAGAQVVNLSLAGPENRVLADAVRRQLEAGTVLVAAVGNAGPRAAPQFPAAYPGVIGVTALDGRDRVWRRAVQGDQVDFAAPGVAVATAASIRGLRPQTGTSFATPFVTAAAAMLVASDPALTPAMVEERLAQAAADLGGPGRDPVFGHGLVQAEGACHTTGTPVSAASDG
jgi:hypothetical protein